MVLNPSRSKPPAKKRFLNSINYFRAIAIILIVLGHCYSLAHWDISSKAEDFFYSLTLNGSVYFVFISGFLYYHIFYHKFSFQKFMMKKVRYVLIPYLVCATIPILCVVLLQDGGIFLPEQLKDNPLLGIGWYFVTGRISYAYWYIPMAVLLFALSPVINQIIKARKVLVTGLLLLPVSLLIQRPIDNLNPFHSLLYFFPVYLIGIWCSINHQKINYHLDKTPAKLILFLTAIALGLVQILVFKVSGNFHKEFWGFALIDVNLLQKILLCFWFVSILDRYEETNSAVANKTAETSFAVYFIHPLVIYFLVGVGNKLNLEYQGNIMTLMLATVVVMMLSIAIAQGLKAVFKQKSRYLIGW